MTGFRVALGGAQAYYNIKPDLTCLGKVHLGGMPVGAFGGKSEIMDYIAPVGPVYQAGTLSGNPIAMAAGLKSLELLSEPGLHDKLEAISKAICKGFEAGAKKAGIPLPTNYAGGMYGFFFTEAEKVTTYKQATECDLERFKCFFHLMLEEGVYLAPSAFEAGFVCAAHTEQEVQATIEAAERAFAKL